MSSNVRFIVLDGMRGLAAIAVVAYHAGNLLHLSGHLSVKAAVAVDFFFCLSGFVLAFAHDEEIRAGTLSAVGFLSSRFVRFFPVVLLGSCIALGVSHFQADDGAAIQGHRDVVFMLSLVLIPLLANSSVVWINGVFWSLCVELLVNVAYAALGRRATNHNLLLLWTVSASILVGCTVWNHSVEMIPYDSAVKGLGALARGFTSFFAGVLIFRLWSAGIRSKGASPIILGATFAVPLLVPYSAGWFKVPLDLSFVLVAFPLIVWIGASSAPRRQEWLRTAGEASFPLYAIHLPILTLARGPFEEAPVPLKLLAVAGFTLLMFLVAVLVAKYYEAPLRGLLRSIRRRADS